MESLKKRAEKADMTIGEMMTVAAKVAEAYAASGSGKATVESIPQLYKNMIIAQIEVFEETPE